MAKGIVIYKSKYGAAKKYAEWLSADCGFDCAALAEAKKADLSAYDTIVLCGGIYASGIAGLSFLKKRLPAWSDKRVAVFCTGASPADEEALAALRQRNMRGPLESVPLFYGRGMWDQPHMRFTDRTLCGLLQKSVAKKDPASYEPWEKALMSAVGQSCDWTDRSCLAPLLAWIDNGTVQ